MQKVLQGTGGSFYFESWQFQLTLYDLREKKVTLRITGVDQPSEDRNYLDDRGSNTDGMPGSGSGFSQDGEAWFQGYDHDSWVANYVEEKLTKR